MDMPIKSYSYDQTITQLFEKIASRYPDNAAVYLEKSTISYQQFNEDVNQYAYYLREKGVTRNFIVAVEMPRSYNMLCAIFAILKAGGAYLPISPDYPEKRKKEMIEDSGAKFLIKDANVIDVSYQVLMPPGNMTGSYSKENLTSINEPNDTAYVIYTSGSTGKPKGVMVAHHALVNRLEWMQAQFPVGANDVLFQKTHYGFDVSVWEIFWWSITGAGVTLLPQGKEDDIILIAKTILEKNVTVIHFVPTVLKIFLEYLELRQKVIKLNSLKYVFSSGEALDVRAVEHFNRLFPSLIPPYLINLYGPTEATIDVTYFVCGKKTIYHEIPIGKAIYNVKLMVLDESLKPLPHGQIGELYIGGVCLAKGYVNNPEQTARCFLKSPEKPHEMMYKTGDLVRWNHQGELCYIGRKDQQVKINGIRIELGEIEHQLITYKNIAQSVVLYIGESQMIKRLVAFIKPKNASKSIDVAHLRAFLQELLPNYMVPNDYVIVDTYPIKENGKLDRKKLESLYLEQAFADV